MGDGGFPDCENFGRARRPLGRACAALGRQASPFGVGAARLCSPPSTGSVSRSVYGCDKTLAFSSSPKRAWTSGWFWTAGPRTLAIGSRQRPYCPSLGRQRPSAWPTPGSEPTLRSHLLAAPSTSQTDTTTSAWFGLGVFGRGRRRPGLPRRPRRRPHRLLRRPPSGMELGFMVLPRSPRPVLSTGGRVGEVLGPVPQRRVAAAPVLRVRRVLRAVRRQRLGGPCTLR